MDNTHKLVEALKMFMSKTITPTLGEDHPSLNQWKFLNGILSSQPIDSSQIDFYLLMSNKSAISEPKSATFPSQHQPSHTSGYDKTTSGSYTNDSGHNRLKSNVGMKQSCDSRRKVLLSNMQNFQNLMIRNQEKLQNFSKKQKSGSSGNPTPNLNSSYNMGSKKYM